MTALTFSHAERVVTPPVCPAVWRTTRTCPHLALRFSDGGAR